MKKVKLVDKKLRSRDLVSSWYQFLLFGDGRDTDLASAAFYYVASRYRAGDYKKLAALQFCVEKFPELADRIYSDSNISYRFILPGFFSNRSRIFHLPRPDARELSWIKVFVRHPGQRRLAERRYILAFLEWDMVEEIKKIDWLMNQKEIKVIVKKFLRILLDPGMSVKDCRLWLKVTTEFDVRASRARQRCLEYYIIAMIAENSDRAMTVYELSKESLVPTPALVRDAIMRQLNRDNVQSAERICDDWSDYVGPKFAASVKRLADLDRKFRKEIRFAGPKMKVEAAR